MDPTDRKGLLDALVRAGWPPSVVQQVEEKQDYDLYDVLAELGWGMNPRTRRERALAFTYKHEDWLNGLPADAGRAIRALAGQFELGGTEELERKEIFQTPQFRAAGGLAALRAAGNPSQLVLETKQRMFTA
jgi:type I restriction enzyme R subunit